MAKRTSKNSILSAKMKKHVDKAKDRSIEIDTNMGVPAGIDNGVAKLTELKIGKYERGDNQGKPYFMIRGVVVSPKKFKGIKVEGLQESFVMEALHATPNRKRKTEAEHLDYMIGIIRSLGVDDEDIDGEAIENGSLAKDLKEADCHFTFSSWKGQPTKQFPNPGTNFNFGGGYDPDDLEDEDEEEVEDETDEEEEDEDVEEGDDEEEDEGDEEEDEGEEEDEEQGMPTITKKALNSLVKKADNGDEDAEEELKELGIQCGLKSEDIELAEDWKTVATDILEAIENAESEDDEEEEGDDEGDEEEEEEELEPPQKEEVFGYKPKGKKKAIECEVTAVYTKKETCNLKSLSDGKLYKAVPWSKLEEVD